MDDNLTGVLIVIVCMAGLVCLRYLKYLNKQTRDGGRLSPQDHAAMERMAQTALRLEQRVASLEKILDTELPSWRDNPANGYERAS